jgi:hypothetical protein
VVLQALERRQNFLWWWLLVSLSARVDGTPLVELRSELKSKLMWSMGLCAWCTRKPRDLFSA